MQIVIISLSVVAIYRYCTCNAQRCSSTNWLNLKDICVHLRVTDIICSHYLLDDPRSCNFHIYREGKLCKI